MAGRVVVAEMGHRALHGLEVEKRLGEYQVLAHHLTEWEPDLEAPGSNPEPFAEAFAKRFESWPLAREGVWTAFPAEFCSFRLIELPFQQPKKIQQIVAYEAESYLPFDLDEILLEYLPAGKRPQGAEVLIAGADRQQFSRFLLDLAQAGMDPAVVSAQGLCLYALSSLEPKNGIRCRAYLDIGACKSRLCVARDGLPVHVSSLSFGGDDLTRKLSEELHLPFSQAEQGKRQEGRVGVELEGLKPEEARVARLLEQGLVPLWPWLENNRRWLERRREGIEEVDPWEELVLCGGTANLRGLSEMVERELGIPARVFRFPASLMPEDRLIPPEMHPQLAEALALALADKPPAINFRKGEFAYRREARIYREKLTFPVALLLLVLMTMGARFWVARSGAAAQINQIRDRMSHLVTSQTGLVVAGDPVAFLEQKLKADEAKMEKYQSLQGARAMEVLAAISEKIPAELSVDLSKWTYNEGRVQMEGETSDFGSAKEIQDYLQAVPFFSKVTLEDTRQSGNGRTRFNIQIHLLAPAGKKGPP